MAQAIEEAPVEVERKEVSWAASLEAVPKAGVERAAQMVGCLEGGVLREGQSTLRESRRWV